MDLTWPDVDPATHPFDPAAAAAIVAGMSPPEAFPVGDHWYDLITNAMVDRYGRWAIGWRWASDEGDIGGGPVHAWCCRRHSAGSLDETLAKMAAALCEWRAWIEELAARFATAEDWPVTVVDLVNMVVAQTTAGDAWYIHCEQVLNWCLTSRDVPADRAAKLVEEAIGGRFKSWVAPDPSVVRTVASKIARAT